MLITATVALAALAAGAVAFGWYLLGGNKPKRVPDKIEAVGPIEIVVHTEFTRSGWTTGRPGWTADEYYSLRYRGRPVTVTGRAGIWGDGESSFTHFNSIITFPAKVPAIVINAGDPTNGSFYALVREGNEERPKIDYLGAASGGVAATLLDGPVDLSRERNLAVHRARLEGGRLLLLGDYIVLDTETMQAYRIGNTEGFYPEQSLPPIACAPDRNSFVRFGQSMDSNNTPMLAAFDFVAGSAETVTLDRTVERFNKSQDMEAAWFNHYFEWRAAAPGEHQRLAKRAGVKPLPYRGDRRVYPDTPPVHEYHLLHVKQEMYERLIRFVEKEFDGKRLPNTLTGHDTLMVGGEKVNISVHGDNLPPQPTFDVGIYNDRGTVNTVVDAIGDRFDRALAASTVYDSLFLP